jgi:hypothetical protein
MVKRAAAFILCCAILSAAFPSAFADAPYMGGGHTYFRSHTTTPAHLAKYTVNTLNHRNAGLTEENILSYTPNAGLRPIVVGPDRVFQNGLTITEAAERLRAQGFDVVGGINGSFFNSNMTLIGSQIRQGVLTSFDREGQTYLPSAGFTRGGEVVLGNPGISVSVTGAGRTVQVDMLNKQRTADLVYMYTRDFSATTRTTLNGQHVVMRVPGRLSLGGTLTGTVTRVLRGTAAYTIADDEMVLSASSQTAIDRISHLTAGSTVTVSVSRSADWAGVTNAVVGLRFLVRNGQTTGASDGARAPRTAIGVRANGTVVLYTADGRQPGYSAGLTLSEVAARLIDMGCVTAIELDGGGSTAMIARLPGERDAKLVNRPSGGSMRRSADYILLCNINPASDGRIARLFPQPAYVTMLPNATASFSFLATDTHFRAVNPPSARPESQSANTSVGTVNGASFTARGAGETLVTFTAGNASGTAQVRVASRLDAIMLTNAVNGQPVNAIDASPRQTVRLAAAATLDRAAVLSTARSYHWAVEGDIGSITADGVFTAVSGPGRRSGRIVVTGIGTGRSVSIPVTVAASTDTPLLRIEGPRTGGNGTELVYTLTAIDRDGFLPENIRILWNGTALSSPVWNANGRAEVRIPRPSDGLHILSVDAADVFGRRARRISVYEPVRPDRWYDGYIQFLTDRNIIGAKEQFEPESPITRLEVFRMLYHVLNLRPQYQTSLPFDDVGGLSEEDLNIVRVVYSTGLVGGKLRPDRTLYLDPDGLITRAELFTVLFKSLPGGYERPSLSAFSDASSVPPFALDAVRTLVGMGVVSGSGGRLNPQGSILRSEAAGLFCQFFY